MVTGMGKSGHVARKIAATLASAGTPAFFVHPGEASHGDLGMITATDMVVALSNSGETDEILTILPIIKRLGIPFVTLTGNDHSRLASEAGREYRRERRAGSLSTGPCTNREHHRRSRYGRRGSLSLCSRRGASAPRTSLARIPEADSAAGFCSISAT